jgi:hypothetical protein
MRPDGNEDTVEVTDGSNISQADEHTGQFRPRQPDTAVRREPVVTGQLVGRAKLRRTGGRQLAARVSDHDDFGQTRRAPKQYP